MKLEEFTGSKLPNTITNLKTAKDVENYLRSLPKMTNTNNLEELAKILGAIGEESLNPNKVVGHVSSEDGTIKPVWEILAGKEPFYIKDPITKKSVPDPRVIYIGKVAHLLGYKANGLECGLLFMQTVFYATQKYFHNSLRMLDYAWEGIGLWRP